MDPTVTSILPAMLARSVPVLQVVTGVYSCCPHCLVGRPEWALRGPGLLGMLVTAQQRDRATGILIDQKEFRGHLAHMAMEAEKSHKLSKTRNWDAQSKSEGFRTRKMRV